MGPGPQSQPHCVPGPPAPSAALRGAFFQDHTASPPEVGPREAPAQKKRAEFLPFLASVESHAGPEKEGSMCPSSKESCTGQRAALAYGSGRSRTVTRN